MSETSKQAYRVLARKYRPQTFEALIGQDAMVRTLRNAIDTGRLAHAFIMTGVRGVGKTTTARLIARALNCVGEDGQGGATISPCGVCDFCVSIAAGSHPDVIEMDAASHTGVDDVRSIIENVPYAAASARYKIYIIDEVHMLSRSAFNALLKTLEEPPEHVKFIFATTEIRKVPVTVLSRCQRFDLRRIETSVLADHFKSICDQENVEADETALALIAQASEGSVRDGLSLLDQAIAHSAGAVTSEQVRDMIGLADRSAVLDLAQAVLTGKAPDALDLFAQQYADGADPIVVLEDLLELLHWLMRARLYPDAKEDATVSERQRVAGGELATKLSVPALSTAWQILMKGLSEVKVAPRPASAAEMVLIRLAYAATLPNPADLVRKLQDNPPPPAVPQPAAPSAPAPSAPVASSVAQTQRQPLPDSAPQAVQAEKPQLRLVEAAPAPNPTIDFQTFEELVARCEAATEGILAYGLRSKVRPVALDIDARKITLEAIGPPDVELSARLKTFLKEKTGEDWAIDLGGQGGAKSLAELEQDENVARRQRALADPVVKRAFDLFPGAKITAIRDLKRSEKLAQETPLPTAPDGYEVLPDEAYEMDGFDDGLHPYAPEDED